MIYLDAPPGAGALRLAHDLARDLHLRTEDRLRDLHQGTDAEREALRQRLELDDLLRHDLTAPPLAVILGGPATVHAYAQGLLPHAWRRPLEPWEFHLLDRPAAAHGAVRVHLTAAPSELAELAHEKEQRPELVRTLAARGLEVLRGLDQAVQWSALPTYHVDGPRLTEEGYQRLLAWLRSTLLRQRPRAEHLARYRASGEWPRPAVALVGDGYPETAQGGADLRELPGARAFLRATGSSWTLHKALTAAGLQRAYLTNVRATGDELPDLFLLRQELEETDPGRVVALGERAGRALRRLKIPHTEVPHPAHHRRFNASAFGGYVKRLAVAASEPPAWPPVHLLTDL